MAIRLLLADDHPIFRAGLRSLLETQSGVEILAEIEDGLGAVEAARTQKPDVVVIDVSMLGMNGLEATRRITAEAPRVKVLCLSMRSDRRFVDAALRSGAHGYLLKECALEELASAIRAVLAGQIYVSPGLGDAVLEDYRAEGPERSALSLLTLREREVLQLLAEGRTMKEIGVRLGITARTVAFHKYQLAEKLGLRSTADLVRYALGHHLA